MQNLLNELEQILQQDQSLVSDGLDGGGGGGAGEGGAGAPSVSVGDAIDILKLSAGLARAAAEGRGPKWRAPPRSLDQLRDSILGKLSRIADARQAEQEAAGWGWCDEHEVAVPPGWIKAGR